MTFAAIWTLLRSLPWKWIGAALAALGIVWTAYTWSYDRGKAAEVAKYQPILTKALARINQGVVALADTKASLSGARAQIDANNARAQANAMRLLMDKAQVANDQALNTKLALATEALRAALLAPNANRKPCVVSPGAVKALGVL